MNIKMGLIGIRDYIIKELTSKSLDDCYYHGTDHSLEVEQACIDISETEDSLADKEIELLRIAALSHDIGHIQSMDNHEVLGCNFIIRVMPNFGYTEEDIELVKSLILVTKFPHKPSSLLENIICDADLSYIGTDMYDCQADKLKKELVELHEFKFNSEKAWIEYQVSFLEKHEFFTKHARDNYNPIKKQIIEKLKKKLILL